MCQDINPKEIFKIIGQNIRRIRLEKGFSQEELAFKIQSARNYIGCIERTEKFPSFLTLYKISKALECDITEIISNIDL